MTKGAERAAGIPQTLDDQQVKRLKEKARKGQRAAKAAVMLSPTAITSET